MGWGSMVARSPEHMACLAVRSLKHAGLRGIILGGWAKLKPEMVNDQPDKDELLQYISKNVLFVDSAPHEWLFPQCSAIVHHGGSGTTAAGLRSGVPSVVTPCMMDQFDNALRVGKSGAGIGTVAFNKVDYKELGNALKTCHEDEKMKLRAKELGAKLCSQNGMERAVTIIDKFVTEDVLTGKWKKKRAEEVARMKTMRSPSCLCFIARVCCMREPFS